MDTWLPGSEFERQLAAVLLDTRRHLGREPEPDELAPRMVEAHPQLWGQWTADVVARRFAVVANRVARRLARHNLWKRGAA